LKIAFFGLPLAACLLAFDGHDVVLAALSRAGVPGRRRLRRLIGAERVLDKPDLDQAFVERLTRLEPDLVVSWFWTSKIPPAVVASAKLGGFGVHPSLLPRHRGPDPTSWAIFSGDAVTGVTAHRIAAEYDTGAILAARALAIDEGWSAWQLARALDRPSLALLRETTKAFARGAPPPDVAQDETLATAAPFFDEALCVIRWQASAAEILRKIRALSPAPGASMEVSEQVLSVLRARGADSPSVLEEPGESIVFRGRVLVRCGDGAIEILEAEHAGKVLSGQALAKLFDSGG
jgi:methionyl-tRNA formyltransferase